MNLPNKLTVIRMAMIPLVMGFMLVGRPVVAAALFLIASFTDYFDGRIARERGLITNFGKIMDPLADKLLVFGAILTLMQQRAVDAWAPMIILAREFLVMGLRVVAVSKGKVIAASWWGKAKTAVQLVTLTLAILFNGGAFHVLVPWAVYICAFVAAVSGVTYVWDARGLFEE